MPKSISFSDLYPSRFLKADQLHGRDVTVTIASVFVEELGEGKKAKPKAIVKFKESAKELVLCRTNGEAIKAMFGVEVDQWCGRRVTLFSKEVESFGEMVDAIRVRGSPEITERITKTIERGPKTIKVDVIPTGKPEISAAPAPEPERDAATIADAPKMRDAEVFA